MNLLEVERQVPPGTGLLAAQPASPPSGGLLGSGWGDPKSHALFAFANALSPNTPFVRGMYEYSKQMLGARDADLKRRFLAAQLEEIQAQGQLRRAQAEKQYRLMSSIDSWMNGGEVRFGNQAVVNQTGNLAPTVTNAHIQESARRSHPLHGVPRQAVEADLAFNEGKGISNMLFKRAQPNWQISNGYAVNTNAPDFTGGFLPGLNISQDGRSALTTVDPQTRLPIVSAPRGAIETYRAYRTADEQAKADFDLTTITPQGGVPLLTTRSNAIRAAQGGQVAPQPGPRGTGPAGNWRIPPEEQRQRDAERVRIIDSEIAAAGDAWKRAQASGDFAEAARQKSLVEALQRERGRAQFGLPAGIPLQSEAERLRETEAVKSEARRNEDFAGQVRKATEMTQYLQRARELLSLDPTASAVGAGVDKAMQFFGASSRGADVATALEALSGWLVANVPRMEGPQSNFDVDNYKTMAGRVGDRTLPVSARLAAVGEIERLQQKYAHLNDGRQPTINSQPDQPERPRAVVDKLPPANPSNKGKRYRDTQTGEVYVSDGLVWKKEAR